MGNKALHLWASEPHRECSDLFDSCGCRQTDMPVTQRWSFCAYPSGLLPAAMNIYERQESMAQYEQEFSKFPTKKITLHHFKNVDDTIAAVINQINTLRSQGLYGQASRLIQANNDVLSQYIIDATTFRTWEEEIYNTQTYAKMQQQYIYFDAQEPDCQYGDVWIGG